MNEAQVDLCFAIANTYGYESERACLFSHYVSLPVREQKKAYEFAEELIETAIEYVHTKEEVEEEHVEAAHEVITKVSEQEKALENAAHIAHHDADDAEEILNHYEELSIGEDFDKRREEAVADLAHNVEDYAESRLDAAHQAELKAREQEEEAKQTLIELQQNEDILKATLEDLKALKKQKDEQEHQKQ